MSRIKELIRCGDSYQGNYTYRLTALLAAEPWDFFLLLVAAQVEELTVRMAKDNPGWGNDRIVGAPANLGHRIADQTLVPQTG